MNHKITLSPEQWASFDRKNPAHENGPLPPCCGNISALRDTVMSIAANDGVVTPEMARDLAQQWGWCVDGHSFDEVKFPNFTPLKSLIEQAGLAWPQRHTRDY